MSTEAELDDEQKVVEFVVDRALKAGLTISVDNGGDGYEVEESAVKADILKHCFGTEDVKLFFHNDGKYLGQIYFVYGNGSDEVIADHTDTQTIRNIIGEMNI